MQHDVDDSAAAQAELAKETVAFTPTQKARMCEAISIHMRSSSSKGSASTKTQACSYLFNFFIDNAWSLAFSKGVQWDVKLEYFCDVFLALGLRNPNDETVKLMIAILSSCSEKKLTPQEAYHEVHGFKTKLAAKRSLYPGAQSMMVFPQDPRDFMKQFPHVYRPNDPPVASKLSEASLRNMTRKDLMPTRSSNKFVGAKDKQQSMHIDGSGSSGSSADKLLDYLLGQRGSAPELRQPQLTIFPSSSHRREVPKCLALPDAPSTKAAPTMPLALQDLDGSDEAATPAKTPSNSGALSTIETMLANAREALTKGNPKMPRPAEA